ncbi:ABC transporter permease subunit [Oscillospiraceae bacterium WX1]
MTTSITGAKKLLKAAAALLFWLAVWFAASYAIGKALILPAPADVWATLLVLGVTPGFWESAGHSLLNVFVGFTSGVVLGTFFAALTSWSTLCDTLISPLIRVIRATPVVSFIILALLWIGKMRVPAFCSALMVIPIVWQSVSASVKDADKNLLEMARQFGFGWLRTLRLVYVPSVRNDWAAACATSMGLAWKSGIAAEVICLARPTIGAELYYSKIYIDTPALFAWTAVVIILSLLLEKVLALLIRKRLAHKTASAVSPSGGRLRKTEHPDD